MPGEPGETGSNDYTASRSDWVVAVVPPPAGISQFQRRTLPGNVFIWTGLARHARIAAITTIKKSEPPTVCADIGFTVLRQSG